MFSKDTRKPRILSNSSLPQSTRKKQANVQTENSGFIFFSNDEFSIKHGGGIQASARQNYSKAVDYINKWNKLMNEYLKSKTNTKNFGDGTLTITNIPNHMAFFLALTKKNETHVKFRTPERKNYSMEKSTERLASSTETTNKNNKISKSKNSLVLPDISEDLSDIENDIPKITKNIQESQYRSYPSKSQYSFSPNQQNVSLRHSSKLIDIQKRSQSANSESFGNNIHQQSASKMSSNTLDNTRSRASLSSDYYYMSYNNNNTSATSIKKYKNYTFGTSPTSSVILQKNQTIPGLLSPNGMIASEINAKGTPIIVKNMFEEMKNNPFSSEGNILKNMPKSVSDSSDSSSLILSDGESKNKDLHQENVHQVYIDKNRGDYCQHPLSLNGRDLSAADKNFINSIGIFTEAGELKQQAKNYLEEKEDVRRGTFRMVRRPTVGKYNENFRLGSVVSDTFSARSFDIKSDV